MPPLKPTGFWSYTSADDAASDGRLSRLRRQLANRLQQQLGRPVHLFQDVAAIPPGTSWEHQIEGALTEASFFVPILTPGFLQSEWCAKEVWRFRAHMEALGRDDLILPVHYLDVSGFATVRRQDCFDPQLFDYLRSLQWVDFRMLEPLDADTMDVRVWLAGFARRVEEALYREVPPPPEPAQPPPVNKLEPEAVSAEPTLPPPDLPAPEAASPSPPVQSKPSAVIPEPSPAPVANARPSRQNDRSRTDAAPQPPSVPPASVPIWRKPVLWAAAGFAVLVIGIGIFSFGPEMPTSAPARPPTFVAQPDAAASIPAETKSESAPQGHALVATPSIGLSSGPIKVGILSSLSGTMAPEETPLKDTVLMMIDDLNKSGGLLGRKVEAVVVDPASNWTLYAEKARQLLSVDKVAVVFGCWTSVSRKAALPVFEELNGLLFYPVQFEGQESSNNVFYTGGVPNQQAIPAVDFLLQGNPRVQRWVLAGTDYIFPRTVNQILEAYLKSRGVAAGDIMINYTPFGHSDWQNIVADIKKFGSAGKKTAVVSTINGDANVPFYRELGYQGISATSIPVMSLSLSEEELAGIDTKPLIGHLAAWNYMESIKNSANTAFIKEWHQFTKSGTRRTNDPMDATYTGFKMWTQAVKKAGTTDVDAVRRAMDGQSLTALGGVVEVMDSNHHLSKPVFIGEIQADGQFAIVAQTPTVIQADAWSPYIGRK